MGLISFIANKLIALGCWFGALILFFASGFGGGIITLIIALILFIAGFYFIKQQ